MGFRSLEDSRKFRERKGGRKGRNITAHIKDNKKMSLMRIQHSHFPLLNRDAQGLTTSPLSTHCKMKARFIKACIKGAMDSAAIKEAKCMIQRPFSLPNQDAQATAALLKDCCEIAIIK